MQMTGHGTSDPRAAFALSVDASHIVRKVPTIQEARVLPGGSVVGDLHGGLTFTDAVAAALESRSVSGWQEFRSTSGEIWTIIVLNR
ncbi:MAG: hypothetical protein C5B51_24000 [Terriglobia bacterium]|nr:MAG: hypothetical protein C5B51_24000 [Terriglobia bacterium]